MTRICCSGPPDCPTACRKPPAPPLKIQQQSRFFRWPVFGKWQSNTVLAALISGLISGPISGPTRTSCAGGLLENGYSELPILGPHALAAATLPSLHADPFDRMLVAQAQVEAITLMTSDAVVARYPGPVQLV